MRSLGPTFVAERKAYSAAKIRCNDCAAEHFKHYGGRGIKFLFTCFDDFLEEVGQRPSPNHQLDRIDNEGNYERGNIQWATRKENGRNKRNSKFLTYRNETKTFAEWVEQLQLPRKRVSQRLVYGWSVEDAFEKPKGYQNSTYQSDRLR